MKWINIILILLVMPITQALICVEPITPNVQCTLLTPSTNATTYELYNSTAELIDSGNLTIFNNTIKSFNITLQEGEYITILSDLSTRELNVNFGDEQMNSWIAIILALSVMTLVFGYFAINLKERKLDSLKAFLFLLSISNATIIGMLSWIISNNPTDVGSFAPIGLMYLGVNTVVLIGIIYYYAAFILKRTIYE